jgi:hypothetical protein
MTYFLICPADQSRARFNNLYNASMFAMQLRAQNIECSIEDEDGHLVPAMEQFKAIQSKVTELQLENQKLREAAQA